MAKVSLPQKVPPPAFLYMLAALFERHAAHYLTFASSPLHERRVRYPADTPCDRVVPRVARRTGGLCTGRR